MDGKKNATQVKYIAELEDGSKRVQETFNFDLERVLKWRDEKMNSRIKKLKCFFSSKKILALPSYETWELIFFLSRYTFLIIFFQLCLFYLRRNWGLLKIFDEKIVFNISFEVDGWLHHGNEVGSCGNILAVDACSGMASCTPILLGEASNKISQRIKSKFWKVFKNSKEHIP